mmetsp:Transcript_33653/g.75972  ORF Transcript_33653/g.75972 Transcript_33653/m.75972 type:complete len:314 (-) Transcript_33653:13-954(-)
MSCIVVNDAAETCANCGKRDGDGGEGGTAKLTNCAACRLVKYCGADCQKAHREQHKKACELRAAELKDERLYGQGQERPEDDFCPICSLPIPHPMDMHSSLSACCVKKVCHGCIRAVGKRGMLETCLFCRTPLFEDVATANAYLQKRVDAKDPAALSSRGNQYYYGSYGFEHDLPRATELWTEAAKLGNIEAQYALAFNFFDGRGVPHDEEKALWYLEKAAMQGQVDARHKLGWLEHDNGNRGRAVRHYLISAKMGLEKSLFAIKDMFAAGRASKEEYAEALREYQNAVEETKSPERCEALPHIRNLHTKENI